MCASNIHHKSHQLFLSLSESIKTAVSLGVCMFHYRNWWLPRHSFEKTCRSSDNSKYVVLFIFRNESELDIVHCLPKELDRRE